MLRIGIDLGGTKIEGITLQENGHELLRKRIETQQDQGYSHILKRIEGLELHCLGVRIAAQVVGFDHAARLGSWQRDKSIMHSERFSWFAAAAADEAIKQSGLEVPFENASRVACIIGSAAGGQISGELAAHNRFVSGKRAVHPMLLARIVCSSAPAHIGIEYGIKGPTYAVCSAGASAAHAISIGSDYIRSGLV